MLIAMGLIIMLSASIPTAYFKFKDPLMFFKKQLFWVAIGLISMHFIANYNYRKLEKYAFPALILSIILLLAVFLFRPINGARSWIIFGNNQFQPSEFIKLCLIIILSKLMSSKKDKMVTFKTGFAPALIIISVIVILILLEPDFGTAAVVAILSVCMLFIGGARKLYLTTLIISGASLVSIAVVADPIRFGRITAFTDPYKDPHGTGYQLIQSLYAIGSGGLFGQGLGGSLQKFFYLPEQHTDFIFSIISEEFGFIGASVIIILFFIFAARGYKISMDSDNLFGCFLASGITTMIIVEATINIAVVTGLMPVTGITLPFISYGGSSLVFKMIGVGILLSISRNNLLKIKNGGIQV